MGSTTYDLRGALELLKTLPGQYVETDVEVDPIEELAGVYRKIGAYGLIRRPTKIGPAAVFNRVKGFPGVRCAIGVLSSRERVAHLLNRPKETLGWEFLKAVRNPIAPVVIPNEAAPCQEVVHLATDPDFDCRRLLMATQNAPNDAGPYVTMGIVRATDPETGESDVTFHRMLIQGRDEMTIFATPGVRHIGTFFEKAEKMGKPLHITVSIGNDPAVQIGAGCAPPVTPIGYDELGVGGALRGQPVELVKAITVNETAIANSEYVIEGMMMPNVRVMEDREHGKGRSMAEFTGYTGRAFSVNQVKVTAVTHRRDPIMQVCIGNSEEHVSMAGIPAEAGILGMLENALPGLVTNVYAPSAGGGKFMAVLQVKKRSSKDDGLQRQAATMAFCAYNELKHVIVVDDDVDIFDMTDVLWAMNTRFQADLDLVKIQGTRGHTGEPSASPQYDPSRYDRGITCKAIFDCTVRYDLKEKFERSVFMDAADPQKFFPNL